MIKEIYNKEVNSMIEYPVDKAVTALNKAGVITGSSGFHSHFDEKRFGLKPCWCIIAAGKIPAPIKKTAEAHFLKTIEVYPVRGLKKWLMTIIYLPCEIAVEKNERKARNIFERFAIDVKRNGRRIYQRKAE